jgi:hypothetical protein
MSSEMDADVALDPWQLHEVGWPVAGNISSGGHHHAGGEAAVMGCDIVSQ